MKVFTASQIRQLDRATIKLEPIASVALMERAARGLCNWILLHFDNNTPVYIFCGRGNNGGDGFALARMLINENFSCRVFLINGNSELSQDSATNFATLKLTDKTCIEIISHADTFPEIPSEAILVDALFGSGLSRPVTGFEANIINRINHSGAQIIAVDIPSGLFSEDNTNNTGAIVKANFTLSFEAPFLSFFFAENEIYTGEWQIINIGLHEPTKEKTETSYYWVEAQDIKKVLKVRQRFAHKGNFGHALLIAGSTGKTGAAVLASLACLRAGCGLLTCRIPGSSYPIIQSACPEAMSEIDANPDHIAQVYDTAKFDAIGIGPGLGTHPDTVKVLTHLIENNDKPMLLDADALNIISDNKHLLKTLKEKSVLTPHPGEFKRLFGEFENSYKALEKQRQISQQYNIVIIRKGAFTASTLPDGSCHFNSTGNPGMATAGSGDVLSGIILSLLAQHYKPEDAALAGVFLHGLSGDLALAGNSFESLIAGDIANGLGAAFKYIEKL